MNDDIIGLFLSETPFDSLSSSEADADKFGRFVDHQDPVIDPSVIGCGIHGIVVLAVIKGVQYALKVVRNYLKYPSLPAMSDELYSSGNGSSLVPSSFDMIKQSTPRRLRTRVEHSPA